MAEIGAPARPVQSRSASQSTLAPMLQCTVLSPPTKIASRWDGALRARLKRVPLEMFLRNHAQPCSVRAPDPLIERIELACLFIIEPALTHRVEWRALCQLPYFAALGQAIARTSRGLGDVVQEPKLWRVAALRAMGRLLTPIMGIDMAASVAAASIATFGFSRTGSGELDETLEALTIRAVLDGSEGDLVALRKLIGEHLREAVKNGAAQLATAPPLVMISAEPPSNH